MTELRHAGDPLPHRAVPFPESLCHRCAAPPRYVKTSTSVFILCPLLPERYPRQPVLDCPLYRPRPVDPRPPPASEGSAATPGELDSSSGPSPPR